MKQDDNKTNSQAMQGWSRISTVGDNNLTRSISTHFRHPEADGNILTSHEISEHGHPKSH